MAETQTNIPPKVEHLAKLATLGLSLNPYDKRWPQGHTRSGDMNMPIYQLQPENGRISSGANGVFVSSTKPGWIWVSEELQKLDIRYWGAKIGTDNIAAIQAANEQSSKYGGTVWVPDGIWDHSLPIIVRSYSHIEGQGPGAVLRNTNSGSRGPTMNATFFLGCHHPAQNYNYKFASCQAASKGVRIMQLKDKAQSALFKIGNCVFIQSTDQVVSGPRVLPICQETKKIIAIDNGMLTLDTPLDNEYIAPKITDPQGAQKVFGYVNSYILDSATIKNLSVETDRGRWCLRAGTYNCLFENIKVIKSKSLIYGNSFYRTSFRKITGNFSERMIEIASGAGFLEMSDVHGIFSNRGEDLSREPAIRVGEYAKNITLDKWSLKARDYTSSSLIKIQSNNFKITNGIVRITGITGSLIHFTSDRAGKVIFRDNTISNCEIYSEGSRQFVRFGGKNGIQPEHNAVINVKFFGSLNAKGHAVSGNSKFNMIKDCWFEDGAINFKDSQFIKNVLIGNSFKDANSGIYEQQNLVRNQRRSCTGIFNTKMTKTLTKITAPKKNYEIIKVDLPPEPLTNGDGYYAFLSGKTKFGAGPCTISFRDQHGELSRIEFSAGETGDFSIESTMYVQVSSDNQLWIIKLMKQGKTSHQVIRRTNVNSFKTGARKREGAEISLLFSYTQRAKGDELVVEAAEFEPRLMGVNV